MCRVTVTTRVTLFVTGTQCNCDVKHRDRSDGHHSITGDHLVTCQEHEARAALPLTSQWDRDGQRSDKRKRNGKTLSNYLFSNVISCDNLYIIDKWFSCMDRCYRLYRMGWRMVS